MLAWPQSAQSQSRSGEGPTGSIWRHRETRKVQGAAESHGRRQTGRPAPKFAMTISFFLAHLTVIGLSPPEVVRVAARTGKRTVGLRLIRVTETSPGFALIRGPK
jgi:hypothetical protein